MASGEGKEHSVQRSDERERTRDGGWENERRSAREGEGKSAARRKREYAPSHHFRERYERPAERRAFERGGGRGGGKKKLASDNALQLEPSTGDGRPRAGCPLQPLRTDGAKNEEKTSPSRKREVHHVREKRRESERQRGRGGEMGKRDSEISLLRRSEERANEAIQLWRDGCGGYADVEPHVTSVWFRYQGVLECDMERAVKENVGQRVWRCIHYPIIELLRKPGQLRHTTHFLHSNYIPHVQCICLHVCMYVHVHTLYIYIHVCSY